MGDQYTQQQQQYQQWQQQQQEAGPSTSAAYYPNPGSVMPPGPVRPNQYPQSQQQMYHPQQQMMRMQGQGYPQSVQQGYVTPPQMQQGHQQYAPQNMYYPGHPALGRQQPYPAGMRMPGPFDPRQYSPQQQHMAQQMAAAHPSGHPAYRMQSYPRPLSQQSSLEGQQPKDGLADVTRVVRADQGELERMKQQKEAEAKIITARLQEAIKTGSIDKKVQPPVPASTQPGPSSNMAYPPAAAPKMHQQQQPPFGRSDAGFKVPQHPSELAAQQQQKRAPGPTSVQKTASSSSIGYTKQAELQNMPGTDAGFDDWMDTDISPAVFQNTKMENYMPPPATAAENQGTPFQQYMKGRKITPSIFLGADCIEPTGGFHEPPANRDLSSLLITQIPTNVPKDSFRQKIKQALMYSQYRPTEEEIRESLQVEPEVAEELSDDWCHIHYYEFHSKIGQSFRGNSPTVTIDGLCAPSDASRFCLGAVANPNRDPVAVSARRQIGKGWNLTKLENGNVMIQSLNEAALFVQCPTHAKQQGDNMATVYRLPGGHSMDLFNRDYFVDILRQKQAEGSYSGVFSLKSMCHMRMSFVKGWGQRYRRQTIMYTPCWAEVHLVQMLQLVDDALSTMQAPECDDDSDS